MTKELVKLSQRGILRNYQYNDTLIDKIIFYNENGIITTFKWGWLENGYNDLKEITLNGLSNRNKINLDKKENFVVKNGDINIHTKKQKLDLYIFVDNKNVIIEKVSEETVSRKNNYSLSINYTTFNRYVGYVNKQKFDFKTVLHLKNVDNSEKEKALKLLEDIKNLTYIDIDESSFLKLYNLCKIELRNKSLLEE